MMMRICEDKYIPILWNNLLTNRFNAGEHTTTIAVKLIDDDEHEPDKEFYVPTTRNLCIRIFCYAYFSAFMLSFTAISRLTAYQPIQLLCFRRCSITSYCTTSKETLEAG